MTQRVRLWKVGAGAELKEISQAKLDLESRLEDWIAADVSMLDDSLLVIGRQLQTDFGGIIDLLCIDPNGDLVILELKRDKTPREIVAQTLDYASWVDSLSHERIGQIAQSYLRTASLEEAFLRRFGNELPENVNNDHRMVVVASEIDPSSERIIEYLSDRHGVSINAATFQYFNDADGPELISRVFLLEPEDVDYRARTKGGSKRKPNLTYEQLEAQADERGVGALYREAVEILQPLFERTGTTQSNVALKARVDGSWNTMVNFIPRDSSPEAGLAFHIYAPRIETRFGVKPSELRSVLPATTERWEYYPNAPEDWTGFAGRFRDIDEVRALAERLGG